MLYHNGMETGKGHCIPARCPKVEVPFKRLRFVLLPTVVRLCELIQLGLVISQFDIPSVEKCVNCVVRVAVGVLAFQGG